MPNISIHPRVITLIMTAIGCLVYAIGIDAFIIPHNLVGGGVSGIALMLYYLTNFSPGTLNLILNIPILFAAYRWLGKWAFVITIYGTIISSLFLNHFTYMADMYLTHNPIIGAIMGGILTGLGSGLIYRYGGNAGGLDPIAQIIRKYWGLQMGSVIFFINCIILVIASFLFSIEAAANTLISIYISAVVTNKIVVGFVQRKAAFIVSTNANLICDGIIKELGRGATLLHGEGAFTHQSREVIFVVVNLLQVTKLKSIVNSVDSKAFLFITDASEVIGQGFTFPTAIPPQEVLAAMSENTPPHKSLDAAPSPKFDLDNGEINKKK